MTGVPPWPGGGSSKHQWGTVIWPDGTVAGCYGFVHALYQQVLYQRVSAAQRVRLHQRIGARLEAGHGVQASAMAAELAMHFERGRDAQRAVQYLERAGERSMERSAYAEAVAHLTRGLEVLQALLRHPRTQPARTHAAHRPGGVIDCHQRLCGA